MAGIGHIDTQGSEASGQEYLVFTLGTEEYGIDILKVQEIRSYETVTRIANAPDFLKGVTNLRGVIVPIVDLRLKFKLGNVRYDHQTVVIILNVAGRVVGIVVDGVSDVLTLTGDDIKPAPEFGVSAITSTFWVSIHCRAMLTPTSGLFWWSPLMTSIFQPLASKPESSTAILTATTAPGPPISA